MRHLQQTHLVRLSSDIKSVYTFQYSTISVLRHIKWSHIVQFISLIPEKKLVSIYMHIIIMSCRNDYIYFLFIVNKCINDVTIFSVLFHFHWFTKVYFVENPLRFLYANLITLLFLHVLSYHSRFIFYTNNCFLFNSYFVKGKNFVVSLILSQGKTSEIVRMPMASLFSLKFFERFNTRYHFNMIFTPIELFTYVVIIALIILFLGQHILRMVWI